MPEQWSKSEVARKMDWEGGVIETMRWGLSPDMIADHDLAAAWAKVYAILPLIDEIYNLIPDSPEDEDDI